ncbi:MAG TPA: ferredoxin [Thermoplasmata archaeon]|nr:ferredoxin [Thermoplasmata archaeon]
MKASVDPDACIGCGLCENLCPEVFEMDEEKGISVVKVDEIAEDAEECTKQAVEECPSSAISVS